jgi:hypothetical protein
MNRVTRQVYLGSIQFGEYLPVCTLNCDLRLALHDKEPQIEREFEPLAVLEPALA